MIDKKQLAADYDIFWENRFEDTDDWTRLGTRPLRMQALRLLDPIKGRILDVGCGNGLALAVLRRRGVLGVGCDISLRGLRDAKAHGQVARADGCHLPFRDGSFQHLLMLDALEHVIEKSNLIRECHRVLSKGGNMVVTTPLPKATAGLGDQRQPYDEPATYEEIVRMTSGLFRVRAAMGVGWAPRGLMRLTRLVPRTMYTTFPFLLRNSAEVLFLFDRQ